MAETNGLLRKLLIQIWVHHAEPLIQNFHIFLDIWLPRWTFHLILLLKSFPTIYKILKFFNGQIKSYGFCILCPNSNPIIKLYFNLVEIKSPLHTRNFACVFIIWEPTSFFFCWNNPLRIWNKSFLYHFESHFMFGRVLIYFDFIFIFLRN